MMRIQEFDYTVDLLQAILWQYNDAVNLQSLLVQKQAWYTINQSQFWTDWYNNVFNLLTANLFGLTIWSIILDVPLYVPLQPEPDDKPIFGFNEVISFPSYENSYVNFSFGNFSNRDQITILTEDEQRFVLRLRYFQLITRGAIPEINSFLSYLLATSGPEFTGQIWVLDGFDMTMTYVFNFTLSNALIQILIDFDLLPRPAGVGLKYITLTDTIFGFNEVVSFPIDENSNQNFFNSNFFPS